MRRSALSTLALVLVASVARAQDSPEADLGERMPLAAFARLSGDRVPTHVPSSPRRRAPRRLPAESPRPARGLPTSHRLEAPMTSPSLVDRAHVVLERLE